MGIFNIFFLNIVDLILILAGFLFVLYLIIHFMANAKKETIAEHIDIHIRRYLFLLIPAVFICFIIFWKINQVLCIALFLWGSVYVKEVANEFTQGIDEGKSEVAKYFARRENRIKRRIALKKATAFLRPYKNIMGKHVISNKYCQVSYNPETTNFPRFNCVSKIKDKKGVYYAFEAYAQEKLSWNDDFFNSLCFNFSYNTKIENIYELFEKYDFTIFNSNFKTSKEKVADEQENTTFNDTGNVEEKIRKKEQEILERIDQENKEKNIQKFNINSASEAEFTALPGINIVQAKKIINYRNINGDFNSVDDFISYLKIKPHFEKQIRERIIATPVVLKVNIRQCIKEERIVDID